ncbi:MAG: Hsp20/alpha crystallin family protein [Bryobacteraceae bacterium]|nr:Hsp20/alpha crystallin family protein [Bryobacteraceae bacterium]
MTLLKYNPFDVEDFPTGLRVFQDTVNRVLSDLPNSSRPWVPAVDILETENELVLRADVPGLKLEDIDIRLENGTLSIKGERKFEKDQQNEKRGYHRIERGYGVFARTFSLPDTIDVDKVGADYKDGVLTVTLPKKEVAKPRTVRVQISNN